MEVRAARCKGENYKIKNKGAENMEEKLIVIHTTHKWPDMNIDFSVLPKVDKLNDKDRAELLELLELLTDRLKNNEYPFSKQK